MAATVKLLCEAGFDAHDGGVVTAEITDEPWCEVVETNLGSEFRVTREVPTTGGMPGLCAGRVIDIASTGGKRAAAPGAPYSASKHGQVETPMAERGRHGYAGICGVSESEVLERVDARIPLGRHALPGEVAGRVGYLVTEDPAAVTAPAMNARGGLGNY